MPDLTIQKSDRNEDHNLILSTTNTTQHWLTYQSRWLAHWTQTRNTSSSSGCIDHKKEEGYLQDVCHNLIKTEPVSEPINRSVSPLRHNPIDSLPIASKRFKTGDDSYKGQAQNFNGPIDYKQQDFDTTSLLIENRKCSSAELKAMDNWIRRWSHASQQAVPLQKLATPVLCEPEKSISVQENFNGKHFPSIRAMALMRRVTSRFRSRQFQRKGSLVIWNTDKL